VDGGSSPRVQAASIISGAVFVHAFARFFAFIFNTLPEASLVRRDERSQHQVGYAAEGMALFHVAHSGAEG
jgi:hypothetical protein